MPEFLEHNFSDLWAQMTSGGKVERVTTAEIQTFIEKSYRPGKNGVLEGFPPDFDHILLLTFSPRSCGSFFRAYPDWPFTERDYYLSKLLQFTMATIRGRCSESTVKDQLHEILDLIPREALPPCATIDLVALWYEFYNDTTRVPLSSAIEQMDARLKDRLASLGIKVKHETPERRRQVGPKADVINHQKVARVVGMYGTDWAEEKNLKLICGKLDTERVPPSKKWRERQPPLFRWKQAFEYHPGLVIKAIGYRLKKYRDTQSTLVKLSANSRN